jgi:hypothetical protein
MTFEDRQRDAMTDFNRLSYSIRELLIAAHKRAQDEANIRKYELEDYERANGFHRQYLSDAHFEGVRTMTPEQAERHIERIRRARDRLDASSNVQKAQIARVDPIWDTEAASVLENYPGQAAKYRVRLREQDRLDASRAYREVTGRDASAGAETYTRRNAEDIHD